MNKKEIYLSFILLACAFVVLLTTLSPHQKQTSPVIPPAPTPDLSSKNPAPVENKQVAYIKKVYSKNQNNFIDIDFIEWVDDRSAPNGFSIINNSSDIRTLQISDTVSIFLIDPDTDDFSLSEVSFNEFSKVSKYSNPFWILRDNSGLVTEIKEQYTP
ncbi:hypothetical protein KKD37_04525 [Patescibacteria group bacterium]|nr:hypothetical protein [Patescibacteria group bacterium]